MAIPLQLVIDILRRYPNSDKRTILSHLNEAGIQGETTSSLNSLLYSNPRYFRWSSPAGSYIRNWRLTKTSKKPISDSSSITKRQSITDQLCLYPWQQRALARWKEDGHSGIIEAVTGAGKTRIALVAAAEHIEIGWRVVTVVPTCELMNQWQKEFERHLCGTLGLPIMIGRLGNNRYDSSRTHHIVIATAASAARYEALFADHKGLLIADECHHYGAEKWSRALDDNCDHRLGLTATYEREDDGCDTYLDPYFNGLSYQLNYEEALADGVIADFKIAFVGATFSSEEAIAYRKYNDLAYRNKKILVNNYGLPKEPFGLFMQAVNQLRHAEKGTASRIAGYYLSAFTRRRHIMAEAEAKLRRIWELRSAVLHADRTIAFAQTRVAAQR